MRIENYNRTVLSLQLIDSGELQIAIDRQADIQVSLKLEGLAFYYLQRLRHRPTLDAEEGTFQSRIAAVGTQNVSQRLIQRVLAMNLATRVAPVVSNRLIKTTAAI